MPKKSYFDPFLTSLNLDPQALGYTGRIMSTPQKKEKHRACDECRTRKLACSKDSDGCERCKREAIVCHYSEQKPMGRPRKRQFIETTNDEPPSNPSLEPLEPGQVPLVANDYSYPDDAAIAQPFYINAHSGLELPDAAIKATADAGSGEHGEPFHFGERMNYGNINFESSTDEAIDPVLDQPPASSSGSNPSASDARSSPSQNHIQLAPCSCLASMYLALASLQQLPMDIVLALKTVRQAAMTASSTIWCPQCGSVLIDKPNPPIEAFQNTMLLGTLIPSMANAYKRLLDMIDVETDAAVALGQTKTFRFHDYGGLCGIQSSINETMACIEKEMMFNTVEMPPVQWRTTVRALLRVDIYGHDLPSFKHRGLKALVVEIQERQMARHAWLERHPNVGPVDEKGPCMGEQSRGCLQILEMARHAIDQVVIA
ncbi:hypothetical protein LOCC1_G000027 [Lachnellula occidentalis]|uniref:Zn(2)-C6 fungal-type domain-containing protein n=1 Tax=Lachnellula occidentalis TaxID=215460 RepID=A0A8H8UKU4_9HELO|nr:hypothetical protein LOCC1_G000027 [Lachnellula occidentalis]